MAHPETDLFPFKTPFGTGSVQISKDKICHVHLPQSDHENYGQSKPNPLASATITVLEEMFGGRTHLIATGDTSQKGMFYRTLKHDPWNLLETRNLPSFQRAVLKETLQIPAGETRSYKEIASSIGCPRGARAVGTALRKNPFPLLIPCHRVIKSNGETGKYAGGPAMKEFLLIQNGKSPRSTVRNYHRDVRSGKI